MNLAVIKTGGKQYKVAVGDKVEIEKLDAETGLPAQAGSDVVFDEVLMVDEKIGTPFISGAKVTGKVLEQGREDKVIVFKFKNKTRYKKKKGHRQPFTKVEIKEIIYGS